MPKLAYQSSRNFFVKTFRDGINTKEDEYVNGQFNMVSAALVNYLPELPVASHENIYKDILLHKKLSILEQSTYEALDAVEVENFSDEIAYITDSSSGSVSPSKRKIASISKIPTSNVILSGVEGYYLADLSHLRDKNFPH